MWEKLGHLDFIVNSGDLHDADNTYTTWASAFQKIADLNAANFAGHNDWRLPNVKELQGLVYFGRSGPAIDSAFNNGTDSFTRPTGTYWSSTTFPSVPGQAYGVSFTTGASLLGSKTSATNFFVRAVRGAITASTAGVLKTGQTKCWDSAGTEITCTGTGQDGEFQKGVALSYTDNGDGTITDNATRLMWEKLGNLDFTANFSDPHDVDNNTYTWAQAFQKIADLNTANFAGYSDWRLPNIMELESLIYYGRVTSRLPGPEIPAVDSAFDNGTDSFTRSNGYTSSTTSLSLPSWAYGDNFLQGVVFPTLSKTTPFANGSVRAVRGPVDGTAPTITLTTPPEGAAYAQNQVVSADYSCQDEAGGSGLASCVGSVASGAPIDTVTLGAHAFTVTATDNAGNTGTVTHNYAVADVTAPTISLTSPPEGAVYGLNQVVNAAYSCQDEAGGSGLASCVGNVASGAPINTATVGGKTFTVTATDVAGNSSAALASYTVAYAAPGTCFHGLPGHQILFPIATNGSSSFVKGLPVPARFRVCDAAGQSVSTPGVVNSFRLIGIKSGNSFTPVDQPVQSALPWNVFVWDPLLRDWFFIIKTQSLAKGKSYFYRITLNDGSVIEFSFKIK
jgi:hypothetical protein